MASSEFDWRVLAGQLYGSPYYEVTDNISSEKDVIATAIAVLDRMSNSKHMREVSWQPVRFAKGLPKPVASLPPGEPPQLGHGATRVERTIPAPRGPLPGGVAVAVPRERLEIGF